MEPVVVKGLTSTAALRACTIRVAWVSLQWNEQFLALFEFMHPVLPSSRPSTSWLRKACSLSPIHLFLDSPRSRKLSGLKTIARPPEPGQRRRAGTVDNKRFIARYGFILGTEARTILCDVFCARRPRGARDVALMEAVFCTDKCCEATRKERKKGKAAVMASIYKFAQATSIWGSSTPVISCKERAT